MSDYNLLKLDLLILFEHNFRVRKSFRYINGDEVNSVKIES